MRISKYRGTIDDVKLRHPEFIGVARVKNDIRAKVVEV